MPNTPKRSKHKKSFPFLNFLIPLAFFLGIGAGYLIWGIPPATTDSVARVNVSTDGDPSIGPENARVTIIEFSDYQCPYCKMWYQSVFSQLMAAYPDKIRFVYRDLPLSFHPEALPAAVAANCAGEQNAYWKFHDAIFNSDADLGRDLYLQIASNIGLDVQAFTACIDSGKMEAEIQADAAAAAKIGITGTPSFVINGRILVGSLPFEDFKTVIDEELAKKK